MRYPAGGTVMIPVSIDVVWEIITKVMHQQVPEAKIAPPRKRHGAVITKVREFVKDNPGRYCTREILQQHPNLNAGTVKYSLYELRRRMMIDQNDEGKWFPTIGGQS